MAFPTSPAVDTDIVLENVFSPAGAITGVAPYESYSQ